MTSQIPRKGAFLDSIKNLVPADQTGVTLLLAILVLSAILAICLSLASVLLIEVSTSGDLTRTEGSFYAANGMSEQSIFILKRQLCLVGDSNCFNSKLVTSFNNTAKLNGSPQLTSVDSPILQDFVLPKSDFPNPNNVYSFCGTVATTSGCGYGKVTVTYVPTGNNLLANDQINVYLCQFDPKNSYSTSVCSDNNSSEYWLSPKPKTLDPSINTSVTWDEAVGLDPNLQQELVITNSSNDKVYITIQTYGPGPAYSPLGLPLFGESTVNIQTINGNTSRKIKVTVPVGNAQNSIKFVQSKTANGGGALNGFGVALNLPSNVTANNTIIVGAVGSTNCVPTTTDTLGNVYTQVGSLSNPAAGVFMYWSYAPVGISGANTVYVNTGACASTESIVFAMEYSGLSYSAASGLKSAKTNTTNSCSSDNITTPSGGQLIVGVFTDPARNGFSAGAGFTQRDTNNYKNMIEDQVQSVAGSVSATASCSATAVNPAYGFVASFE